MFFFHEKSQIKRLESVLYLQLTSITHLFVSHNIEHFSICHPSIAILHGRFASSAIRDEEKGVSLLKRRYLMLSSTHYVHPESLKDILLNVSVGFFILGNLFN